MPGLTDSDTSVSVLVKTTADNTGINDTNKGLDSLSSTANETTKNVSSFSENFSGNMKKVGLATAAVGAGLTLYAKSSTDYLAGLAKETTSLSRVTGMSTEQSSGLLAVTTKLGISAGQVTATFGAFSKKINEAANNTEANRLAAEKLQIQIRATQADIKDTTDTITKNGDSSGALKLKLDSLNNTLATLQDKVQQTSNPLDQLNINTKKADGTQKDFNTILLEVADKFKAMPNGATKTALALDLFGRSGKDLLKVLNLGSQGIQEMEDKAKSLGLTLTSKNIAQVSQYIQSQKALKEQTDALKISVGELTMPVLTSLNTHINALMGALLSTHDPFRGLIADTIAFGGPAFTAAGAVLTFSANLVSSWPAIVGATTRIQAMGAAIGLVGGLTLAALAAGIVVDAALIVKAVQSVTGAMNAWTNASNAAVGAGNAMDDAIRKINASNLTPSQKAAKIRSMSGFAGGVTNFGGGMALVGEEGPEIVDLPRGSNVHTNSESKKMVSNKSISIGTVILGNASAAKEFFRQIDNDTTLSSRGLTPVGGAA